MTATPSHQIPPPPKKPLSSQFAPSSLAPFLVSSSARLISISASRLVRSLPNPPLSQLSSIIDPSPFGQVLHLVLLFSVLSLGTPLLSELHLDGFSTATFFLSALPF